MEDFILGRKVFRSDWDVLVTLEKNKVWKSWMVFCVVKWVLSLELLSYVVRSLLSLPQFIILPLKGWRFETPIASWKTQSLWSAYFKVMLTGAFKTIVNKSF